MQLAAGLLPRGPGFDPRPVNVGFVVDTVAGLLFFNNMNHSCGKPFAKQYPRAASVV